MTIARPALLLLLSAAFASAQPAPPRALVYFAWRADGATNAERFVAPAVHGPLVEGGQASVSVDARRFLFPAGCPDPTGLARVELLTFDAAGTEVRTALQLGVDTGSASGLIVLPRGLRALRVGFEATTASGWRARDTRFETFYEVPVDRWSAPALLAFDEYTRRPAPAAPLRAGEYLVVDYALARARADTFATDVHGARVRLTDASLWYHGGETLTARVVVQPLDAHGQPIGAPLRATVLHGGTTPGLAADRAYLRLPDATRRVRLYVEAANLNGPRAWDSDDGADFFYDVQPPATVGLTGGLGAP